MKIRKLSKIIKKKPKYKYKHTIKRINRRLTVLDLKKMDIKENVFAAEVKITLPLTIKCLAQKEDGTQWKTVKYYVKLAIN